MASTLEQRAAREAKLDELHEKLTGAVEQLVSGDDWRESAGRDRTHQADRAAAIDEANAVIGEGLAKGRSRINEFGIGAGTGTAIDADVLNRIHSCYVAISCDIFKTHLLRCKVDSSPNRLFSGKESAGAGAKSGPVGDGL